MTNPNYPYGQPPGQVVQPGMQPAQTHTGVLPPAQMVPQSPAMPVTTFQPAPVPAAVPAPPPGMMALPPIHAIDEELVKAGYAQAREAMARTGGPQYVKYPGPGGEEKWPPTTPVNFESVVELYLAPPWAAGKNIFRVVRSHFWKSMTHPGGKKIGCPGPASCLICKAKEQAMNSPDPAVKQQAKNYGRVRTEYLYNAFLLANPQIHMMPTGEMRPLILAAGAQLHAAIGNIVEGRKGAMNVVDPTHGRPIRVKRKKTGPAQLDVEYSAIDSDPSPLPPVFFPAMHLLWDLDAMEQQPSYEDMMAAVMDIGLPLPGAAQAPMPAQAMAPPTMGAPNPAYPTPYAAPAVPAPVAAPPAMPAMAPGVPPPVQSAQTPAQPAYSPQPAQVATTALPPPPPAVAGVPAGVPAPPPIQQPGAANTAQPVCFGKYNSADNSCAACAPGLKGACMAQAGTTASPPGADQPATMEQLQNQLKG